jgi:toxin ParE1/3/4
MSKRSYELTALARLDLLHAWNYLAENASLDIADRMLADIESAIRAVAKAPGHGHERSDLTKRNIRFYLCHSYLIIYRPDRKPIKILRVLHAARDVQSLLDE